MATPTTNYSLMKPAVNDPVDQDLWGPEQNAAFDIIDSALDTRQHDLNFAGKLMVQAIAKRTAETSYDAGNISGAVTLDYANGNYQHAILTGNVTSLTINNLPATGMLGFMTLELNQDGTGGRTFAGGSAFKTPSGAGISLSSAATAVDFIYLTTRDAGTTINTILAKDFR